MENEKDNHLKKILALLEENPYCTLQHIGNQCGVTRERVRQILKKNGIIKKYGNREGTEYVTLILQERTIVDIVSPKLFIGEITKNNFNPTSPNFLGIDLDKIHTNQINIRNSNKHKHSLLNFPTSTDLSIATKDPRKRRIGRSADWRCYICKPLYQWQYINERGQLQGISLTRPCSTCNKPVMRSAALLNRILKDDRYKGNFYCNRECFQQRITS